MSQSAKVEIENLRKELEKHRVAYHVHDKPTISDEVYDSMMTRLAYLENKYPQYDDPISPTRRVGGEVLDAFQKVTHKYTQWSFDNVFSFQELSEWNKRNTSFLKKEKGYIDVDMDFMTELKIDGLKIILEYKKGELFRASTRGDGVVGEDVTHNVKTIRNIPYKLSIPLDMVIVGECYISKADFEEINNDRLKNNETLYQNPRNLAAGTLRQLDSSIVAKES